MKSTLWSMPNTPGTPLVDLADPTDPSRILVKAGQQLSSFAQLQALPEGEIGLVRLYAAALTQEQAAGRVGPVGYNRPPFAGPRPNATP